VVAEDKGVAAICALMCCYAMTGPAGPRRPGVIGWLVVLFLAAAFIASLLL